MLGAMRTASPFSGYKPTSFLQTMRARVQALGQSVSFGLRGRQPQAPDIRGVGSAVPPASVLQVKLRGNISTLPVYALFLRICHSEKLR